MKNTAKTPGHHTGRFVDWMLKHWLQLILVGGMGYGLFMEQQFVDRFLVFTDLVYQKMEQQGKPAATPEMAPGIIS